MSSHVLRNRKGYISAIGVFVFMITVIVVQAIDTKPAIAQEKQLSMQSLLLRLNERQLNDMEFVFGIEFYVPLGDEQLWRIGDPNDQYHRSIEEVGADYVCFRERHDSFHLLRCTPLSNLSEVSYMVE